MATRRRAERLLDAALRAVPGAEARPGQRDMVLAVDTALRTAEHLLVQAGTGTGKSLGYLVPALASGKKVVVATATKALQSQLVEKDLPRLVKELDKELGRTPTFALAKGRGNYACLQQVHGGPGAVDAEPDGLFEAPGSGLGRTVLRLREWAGTTQSGDRDDVPFPVSDAAWRQVSVSARDCLGTRCPDRVECFAEKAKEAAKDVDVVVANHALLALDAFTGVQVLPEHDAVVLDEAHEFVAAATEALSKQISAGELRRAVGAASGLLSESVTVRLDDAQDALEGLLGTTEPGLLPALPPHAAEVLALVETVFLAAAGELGRGSGDEDELDKARRERARTTLTEVAEAAAEIRSPAVPSAVYAVAAGAGVLLRVSPLRVGGALATRLFGEKTVVATSATLTLGGSFRHTARGLGLTWLAGSPVGEGEAHDRRDGEAVGEVLDGDGDAPPPRWRHLDVGSPFDVRRQGQL
ncbi:MAG: ATP-dependent helicase, partial [Frankiales bacterium]|nr:ATP-dependent helicase [Frankiales bacterium]